MGFATTEEEWEDRASRFLKAELKRAGITYAELVKRLEPHGFKETEASVTNKLKRGKFSATFFLAVVAVIGLAEVALEDL
jgi:hypothetical protein